MELILREHVVGAEAPDASSSWTTASGPGRS